jgi:uncharacterized protein YhbP (UPF0306 family)
MDSVQKAKYLLETNEHMIISTADAAGKPWISPVFFAYDSRYNLYWVSNREAIHSQNLKLRPQTAIVVYGKLPDGPFDGVYFDAVSSELSVETEIKEAMKIYAQRPQSSRFTIKSIADVTGSALWRLYKATPKAIFKCAVTTEGGQAITVREPISL